ncbi:MAG: Filamentation induced by cAMP protein Fic [Microgenomates group bacterium GW2011_GWA2_47_8]|nr:MAG: Filamentation induced by cAMP protein Fic [Microgenomates group bacterium GW2011_GWA2_47_8]
MAELLRYLSEQKIETDPLILAGLFHKQFVLIHPFMDGNGRTARLITKLFLARMGLNTFNLFSFENYYNQNVTAYFQNVGAFGNYYELAEDIEYTLWLEYFTGGIIDELLRVQAELSTLSAHPASLIRPHHKVILDFIKENGSITPGQYAKLTSRSRASRAVDFRRLLELGLIRSHGQGKALYYTLTED